MNLHRKIRDYVPDMGSKEIKNSVIMITAGTDILLWKPNFEHCIQNIFEDTLHIEILTIITWSIFEALLKSFVATLCVTYACKCSILDKQFTEYFVAWYNDPFIASCLNRENLGWVT